jgi:hypothetical protein
MYNESNVVMFHPEQMSYSLLPKTVINTLHLALIASEERHAIRSKLPAKRGCSRLEK